MSQFSINHSSFNILKVEFISKELDEYVCKHSSEETEVLADLNRTTHVHILNPRMLSGHFQGRVLSMLSRMIRPKNILEIGTYTGYSAICFAEGLTSDGKLITIDVNEELEEFVHQYVEKSGNNGRIIPKIGDAKVIIPELNEDFDIVFIDADKKSYSLYYDLVFDKVKVGGYLIIDNILWSGKVLGEYEKLDKETQSIMDFNKKVQEDDRVFNVLLPIRDGLMIVQKTK